MNPKQDICESKTLYREGFLQSEMDTLLLKYPSINREKFNDALFGVTCIVKDKDLVFYHRDVLVALHLKIVFNSLRLNPRPLESLLLKSFSMKITELAIRLPSNMNEAYPHEKVQIML
jgi:hypothetical protein